MDLRYRHSRYREKHRFTDGTSERRIDDRLRVKVGLNYKLTKSVDVVAAYTHTDNNSSIDSNKYERDLVSLGVNWYF